jgi:hypothetical protein
VQVCFSHLLKYKLKLTSKTYTIAKTEDCLGVVSDQTVVYQHLLSNVKLFCCQSKLYQKYAAAIILTVAILFLLCIDAGTFFDI